jgi:hypothetical protein
MFAAGKPPRGAGGRPPRRGEQIKPYGEGRGPMPGPAVNVLPSKPTMPGMGGGPMPGPVVGRPPTMPSGPGPMPGPVVNRPPPTMGMKKGGSASSRADGCAQRGKTKGKIV